MAALVLEFNELSPTLIDRFIAAGELPNFDALQKHSLRAVTDAEEAPPNLEPWIQWVTVHTGLGFADHRCFHLNDGVKLDAPRIWDLVSAAGKTNWICGSMNGGYRADSFRGFYLPDPWASQVPAQPAGYFEDYLGLVSAYVQEHSARPDVSPARVARFVRFMASNGLSASSVMEIVRQLASERLSNRKWRRAMILDRLQWDLFRSVYAAHRPDFATFFLNSTAHFQHFHWREMEPELFAVQPSGEERSAFGSSVLDGYRAMDRIVGQAARLAGDNSHLVLLTGLSQQPMLDHEESGGRQIFRHRDIGKLLAFAGLRGGWNYAPLMSQQFLLHFESDEAAAAAAERIEGLRMSDGQQPMWARRQGATLDAGCRINTPPASGVTVSSTSSNKVQGFYELFYPLEALRSGKHHPDGIFWVAGPGVERGEMEHRVPLRQIAPTLAEIMGCPGSFELPPLFSLAPRSLAA